LSVCHGAWRVPQESGAMDQIWTTEGSRPAGTGWPLRNVLALPGGIRAFNCRYGIPLGGGRRTAPVAPLRRPWFGERGCTSGAFCEPLIKFFRSRRPPPAPDQSRRRGCQAGQNSPMPAASPRRFPSLARTQAGGRAHADRRCVALSHYRAERGCAAALEIRPGRRRPRAGRLSMRSSP